MIIYPLPPQELDDVTLSRQIKNVAQVLCNVHHKIIANDFAFFDKEAILKSNKAPIGIIRYPNSGFNKWAATCRANYLKLVEMGIAACEEYTFRFSKRGEDNKWKDAGWIDFSIPYYEELKQHKLQAVIEWAASNIPSLPE
jgi:hypothetical protein